MSKFKRRPSPATAISLLALFVALGGSATAATVLIKNSSQIKNGSVARADIADDAINSKKIADGKVKLNDLGANLQKQIGSGSSAPSTRGAVTEVFRNEGPSNVAASNSARVITKTAIPAGSYVILGKVTLAAEPRGGLLGEGNSAGGHCALHVQTSPETDNADEARTFLASPGANTPGTVNTQITVTFDRPGTAFIDCDVTGAPWSAANSSIIAAPVAIGPREAVTG